jgi:hypothetical protein
MRLAWLGKRREHPRPPIQPMRLAAQAIVAPFLETFREFPPSQKEARVEGRVSRRNYPRHLTPRHSTVRT